MKCSRCGWACGNTTHLHMELDTPPDRIVHCPRCDKDYYERLPPKRRREDEVDHISLEERCANR